MRVAFEGMTLTRADGNTTLTGCVRDQAELQGLLQRVSGLGLTLLEASAVQAGTEVSPHERPAPAVLRCRHSRSPG